MNGALAVLLLIIFILFLIGGISLIVMKNKINMNQTAIVTIGIIIIVISVIAILAIIFMWISDRKRKNVKIIEIKEIKSVSPRRQSQLQHANTIEIEKVNRTNQIETMNGITPLQVEKVTPILVPSNFNGATEIILN